MKTFLVLWCVISVLAGLFAWQAEIGNVTIFLVAWFMVSVLVGVFFGKASRLGDDASC